MKTHYNTLYRDAGQQTGYAVLLHKPFSLIQGVEQ